MNLITKDHICEILAIADNICDDLNSTSGENSWGIPFEKYDEIAGKALQYLATLNLPVGPLLRPLTQEELEGSMLPLFVIVTSDTLASIMRINVGEGVLLTSPIKNGFVIVEHGESMSAASPDWIAMEIGQ